MEDIFVFCPKCDDDMSVLMHRRKGDKLFIGCSAYPKCRYTTSVELYDKVLDAKKKDLESFPIGGYDASVESM